ncbi:RNA polymerase sigma factor [Clostridium minihomine]|uniref:RNA polymerase sigma factor n=1 Tax=Clostridium minihomine TaxID=2045012 RepID=UPI000C77FE42|nr:sigma-70 family RNA polymerase sigma factor [Clostridium minihomine]
METNEELALRVKADDNEAVAALWEQTKKLAYKFALQFYNRSLSSCASAGITLEDVQQELFLVVLDAARAFDQTKGFKFTSFMSFHAKNRFNGLIGLRTSKSKNEPLHNCMSLDEPIKGNTYDMKLSEIIIDQNSEKPFEDVLDNQKAKELKATILLAMERLTNEQQRVIQCRYYEKKTYDETGADIGKNRSMARQLEANALREMRRSPFYKQLAGFLYDELESAAYKGTGLKSFQHTWTSSVERTAEQIERVERL